MSGAPPAKRVRQAVGCHPAVAAKYRAKHAAHRAVHAAKRANARAQAVDEADEIETLKEQLSELDDESDPEITEEYVIIKARSRRLQVQCNQAATREENKKLEFVCAVCFDECLIECLRIATPCGHGFCEECTVAWQAAAKTGPPDERTTSCPTCRGPVVSVLQPFF
jgi:Zinc finger, C3HC4 type (RING finger)